MQYALLIYDAELDNPPEDEGIYGEYMAISGSPGIVGGNEFEPATAATTVRVRNGETQTSDGPFVETGEPLGGYFVFEADDLDAAVEIAARIPAARRGGAVEVRPVVGR